MTKLEEQVADLVRMAQDFKLVMKSRIRSGNQGMSHIAGRLGYSTSLSEKERASIIKRAGILQASLLVPEWPKDVTEDERDAMNKARTLVITSYEAMQPYIKQELSLQREMAAIVETMKIAPFVESIPGLTLWRAGLIIGNIGNMSKFDSAAKVWARMGLGIIDGQRQRKIAGKKGKDSEGKTIIINLDEIAAHGYNPQRRSQMYIVEEQLIRSGKSKNSLYYKVYIKRKDYEIANGIMKGHAHNRASRYMVKRLLKNLWVEWNMQYNKEFGDTPYTDQSKAVYPNEKPS